MAVKPRQIDFGMTDAFIHNVLELRTLRIKPKARIGIIHDIKITSYAEAYLIHLCLLKPPHNGDKLIKQSQYSRSRHSQVMS